MAVFGDLNDLNINGHTEVKEVGGKKLTYLSWPWAWAEVKKRYPDAHYEIWRGENGLPYSVDPQTGYMVFTSVTIEGVTHDMWLPVMNGANKAMKPSAYKYKVGTYEKECEAATMTDINKTIMRCLVKNLAMFGLGLYIYAGEDLPEAEQETPEAPKAVTSQPQRKAAQKPQNAPQAASVTTVGTVPQVKPEAPKQAEKPAETKPETPGMFMQRRIAGMKAKYQDFDFVRTRKALIAGGVVRDIPSATMTMEQAVDLMDAVEHVYMTPVPGVQKVS